MLDHLQKLRNVLFESEDDSIGTCIKRVACLKQTEQEGPDLSVTLFENHYSGFTSPLHHLKNSETPVEANVSVGMYNLFTTSRKLSVHFILPHFIENIFNSHHFTSAVFPYVIAKSRNIEFPLQWQIRNCTNGLTLHSKNTARLFFSYK